MAGIYADADAVRALPGPARNGPDPAFTLFALPTHSDARSQRKKNWHALSSRSYTPVAPKRKQNSD
jgi:hypothetical protein